MKRNWLTKSEWSDKNYFKSLTKEQIIRKYNKLDTLATIAIILMFVLGGVVGFAVSQANEFNDMTANKDDLIKDLGSHYCKEKQAGSTLAYMRYNKEAMYLFCTNQNVIGLGR